MRKLIVEQYTYNTSELILKDPLSGDEYTVFLEFREINTPCKGSVLYISESYLRNDCQKLIFGPIGISPLAKWMPNEEREFLLLNQNNSNTATLLQRYYP